MRLLIPPLRPRVLAQLDAQAQLIAAIDDRQASETMDGEGIAGSGLAARCET